MMQDWKTYRLSEFININPLVKLKANEKHSFVEMKDLDANLKTVIPSDFKFLKGGAKFQNGDTLFARITPCLQNGKICQVKDLHNNVGFGSTEFLVFRGKEGVSDKDFVYYLSREPYVRQFAEANMIGTSGRQRVAKEAFHNIKLELPPLREQKAIASILSALDDKIELNLQMNKTLEEMAMALYKHWFVDFGPFQNGKFVESELGMIPKGWEVKSILEIVDLLSGGTPKTSVQEYWNGDINWVSAKDIGNGGLIYIYGTEKTITREGVNNSSTKILPEDTVILVARGSVGKYGMIAKPMAMNQSCYGLFTKGDFSQALVYLMFSRLIEQFKRVAYGSVFDTITTSTFITTNVIIPPKDIVNNLKDLIDPIFVQLKQNTLENQSLTTLRDTLSPKLISGEVRVKDVETKIAAAL